MKYAWVPGDPIPHGPTMFCALTCDNPYVCKAVWDSWREWCDRYLWQWEFATRDAEFQEVRIYEDGWFRWYMRPVWKDAVETPFQQIQRMVQISAV